MTIVDDHPAAYRALGTTFGIVSDRADLLEWFDHVWRHARTDAAPEHRIAIVSPDGPDPDGPWVVAVDDAAPESLPAPLVVPRVHWEINRLARAARGDAVLLHAGVVEVDGTGVLLVGPSGAGKSTLTLGLCERGAVYLSDELAPVSRSGGSVGAFPKPLALRPGSWPLVQHLHPGLPPALAPLLRDEWFVSPERVAHETVPRVLLFVTHDPAAPGASLTAIDPAAALVRLCEQADELALQPAGAFEALGALIGGLDAHALRSADLDVTCGLVLDTVQARGSSR
jgi:hypothetical protein